MLPQFLPSCPLCADFLSLETSEGKFRWLIPGGNNHVLYMYCKMTKTRPDDAVSYSEEHWSKGEEEEESILSSTVDASENSAMIYFSCSTHPGNYTRQKLPLQLHLPLAQAKAFLPVLKCTWGASALLCSEFELLNAVNTASIQLRLTCCERRGLMLWPWLLPLLLLLRDHCKRRGVWQTSFERGHLIKRPSKQICHAGGKAWR